jgi:hypothetical protein
MAAPAGTGSAAGFPAPVRALLRLPVSRWLGVEYVPVAEDVLRMVCIQAAIQAMLVLSVDPVDLTGFLAWDFVLLLAFVAVGVLLYWLLVRRVVAVE